MEVHPLTYACGGMLLNKTIQGVTSYADYPSLKQALTDALFEWPIPDGRSPTEAYAKRMKLNLDK